MEESTKEIINFQLEMLLKTLKETNTVIGILVDKNNVNNSKIAFLDYDSVLNEKRDGFTVDLMELNKGTITSYHEKHKL